jgi:hypothetical protein
MYKIMNSINIFIAKIKLFFLSYKVLFFILIIIFIPIFFYFFAVQKNLSTPIAKRQNTIENSHTTKQTPVSLSPSKGPINSPVTLAQEANEIASGKLKFTKDSEDGKNIKTISLPDGSTEYEYSSDDLNRPDVQIVKDNIVVFQRNSMSNATISDYSEFLTNPPYATQGSIYYGSDAVILANPMLGVAAVYNPESNQVYEQYLFQKMSINDYVQKFGKDISTFNPAH